MSSISLWRNFMRPTSSIPSIQSPTSILAVKKNVINKTCTLCRCSLPNVSIVQTHKSNASMIQTRSYKPYSVLPKKYRITKNRYKELRDDVYFLTDQAPPRYSIDEAVNCLRAYDLFGPEKIDLLLKVDLGEGRDKVGALKGLVNLPYPVNPEQIVLVFAEGDVALQVKEAGADIVGGLELVKKVENGELEFDHCLSTLDFLPNIKHLPRILRNKMPNTRRGTATDNIVEALKTYKQGETYVADNLGNIRQTLGKTSFRNDEVKANIEQLFKSIASHSPLSPEKFFSQASLIIPSGPKVDLLMNDVLP